MNVNINASHVAATSGITAMLADVYMYLSHWPLQSMDQPTAMAFAGLTIAILGGGGIAALGTGNGGTPSSPPPQTSSTNTTGTTP
jgi:hypothetical protein